MISRTRLQYGDASYSYRMRGCELMLMLMLLLNHYDYYYSLLAAIAKSETESISFIPLSSNLSKFKSMNLFKTTEDGDNGDGDDDVMMGKWNRIFFIYC